MALDFKIDEPRFSQSELLQLVPGLSSGTLQNWIARKVIDVDVAVKPGKHQKVSWTAISAVGLRIMVEMTKFGLKPAQAFAVADELIQEIDSFVDRFEQIETEIGNLEYQLEGDRMPEYRRFRIIRDNDGNYRAQEILHDADDMTRMLLVGQYVTIVIEADILFLTTLNRVSRLCWGRLDLETGQYVDDPNPKGVA